MTLTKLDNSGMLLTNLCSFLFKNNLVSFFAIFVNNLKASTAKHNKAKHNMQ